MVRIGFAKRDVSPPVLPADDLSIPILGFRWERAKAYRSIHDPLFARVMAVEAGGARALVYACDLFGDAIGFSARVAARLEEAQGVPAANVFFSYTHVHTSPDTLNICPSRVASWWIDQLVAQLVTVGEQALAALRPATLHWGEVPAPGLAVNRRLRAVTAYEKQHGPLEPVIRDRALALDEALRTLWAVDGAGKPLGAVANFAAHPVVVQTAPMISADFCGPAAAGVEQAFGDGFVCLYVNGPCGDINPACGYTMQYADCVTMGSALAERACAALDIAAQAASVVAEPVRGVLNTVKVRRQTIPNVAELRQREAELAAQCRQADADGLPTTDERHPVRHLIGVRETLAVDALPMEQDAPVHALRVGDLRFISFPGELFTVLGLDVRRAVGGKVMLAECSRAHLGYLCPREAFRIGGYEIGPGTWSWLAAGGGEAIAAAGIAAAQSL